MGFTLVSLSLLVLVGLIVVYKSKLIYYFILFNKCVKLSVDFYFFYFFCIN
jgi:hypothetical protein